MDVRRGRPAPRRGRRCLALVVLAVGCAREPASMRRIEEQALLRQIESLRQVAAAIDSGELGDPDHIVVGVHPQLLQSVLRAAMPVESDVGKRLRIRLERAVVRLDTGASAVRIQGRVWARKYPSIWADLALSGGLAVTDVDPMTATLLGRVEFDDFEVTRAGHGISESVSLRLLVSAVADAGFDELSGTVPPISIPVGFGRELSLGGTSEGPVTIRPVEVPLRARVAQVLPASDRLWIVLAVDIGPWRLIALPPPVVPR